MTDTLIEWNKDGVCTTCENLIAKTDNTVTAWTGPPMNAVLIQVFRGQDDEDGNPTSWRFITTLITDPDMKDLVHKEADKVLKSLRNI